MPEGDTVYQAAKRLHATLAGRTLVRSDIRVPRFATVDLAGQTVIDVVSRGKHLLMHVGEWTLHSHLKMEGSWRLYAPGERWDRPSHKARAILTTSDIVAVGWELGLFEVLPRADDDVAFAYLGPDLLGADWNAGEAVRRVESAGDLPVAVALLDQRNLAGLGNVYVNELCFLRGIRPQRLVSEVPDVAAAVDLGRRLIVANRDRVSRVTTGVDRRGERLWVYGREGQRCRRCGSRIEHADLGKPTSGSMIEDPQERVTYWCPTCQS